MKLRCEVDDKFTNRVIVLVLVIDIFGLIYE